MLSELVKNLEVNKVRQEVERLLSIGTHPRKIQEQLFEGSKEVGKKYESGECFIGDLIVTGMMIKEILSMDEMKTYLNDIEKKFTGKIVLGTVHEDIHDIGKDIMKELYTAEGFDVLDLGVDVSSKEFVDAIQSFKPDIVGISCILTTCVDNVSMTIKDIDDSGLRDGIKIIVGGGAINPKYSTIKGVDSYTNDAYEGLKICETWMHEKNASV